MYTVYQIKNPVGELYIGLTEEPLPIRFSKHCYESGRSPERKICQSLIEYGPENHEIEPLELIMDYNIAKRRERELIVENKTIKHGLNTYCGFKRTVCLFQQVTELITFTFYVF